VFESRDVRKGLGRNTITLAWLGSASLYVQMSGEQNILLTGELSRHSLDVRFLYRKPCKVRISGIWRRVLRSKFMFRRNILTPSSGLKSKASKLSERRISGWKERQTKRQEQAAEFLVWSLSQVIFTKRGRGKWDKICMSDQWVLNFDLVRLSSTIDYRSILF
jgi:hypothetical protein